MRVSISGFGDETESKVAKSKVHATLRSKVNDFKCEVEALIVPALLIEPAMLIEKSAIDIPSELQLADPLFYRPGPIDILLGADLYYYIEKDKKISLGNHNPVLKLTEFGWIIGGNTSTPVDRISAFTISTEEENLNQFVGKFWNHEEISPSVEKLSPEEQVCEERFKNSIQREPDGRFSLLLPFRKPPTPLGNSFENAARRFKSLERRFQKDVLLAKDYKDAIHEFLNSNFATTYNRNLFPEEKIQESKAKRRALISLD